MQLKYRGQSYSPCHTVQSKPQTMSLQFLGQSYQAKGSQQPVPKPTSKAVLQFLGCRYALG